MVQRISTLTCPGLDTVRDGSDVGVTRGAGGQQREAQQRQVERARSQQRRRHEVAVPCPHGEVEGVSEQHGAGGEVVLEGDVHQRCAGSEHQVLILVFALALVFVLVLVLGLVLERHKVDRVRANAI